VVWGRIRVVVADDDETMRRAIVDVLTAHGGFHVVRDVGIGAELPGTVAGAAVDLVALDVRMPSGGPKAARALRALAPSPVLVAVSASSDVTTVADMFRAGVTGFLAKGHLGTTFADDLVRCTRGQVMIALPQAAQVLRALSNGAPDGPET
jgi:DNA-binding NarL/FixJ family response regulator